MGTLAIRLKVSVIRLKIWMRIAASVFPYIYGSNQTHDEKIACTIVSSLDLDHDCLMR